MGLEDRDWYREKPSGAWKDRWRGSSREASAPSRRSTSGGISLRAGVWSAVAVSAVATAAGWHFDWLKLRVPASSKELSIAQSTAVVPPTPVLPTAPNVVRLTPRPGLDTPVTAIAKWSVTGPRFGTVSVVVPIGKTPREALVVAFAERGFQLVG
jgi:hypothetical protein